MTLLTLLSCLILAVAFYFYIFFAIKNQYLTLLSSLLILAFLTLPRSFLLMMGLDQPIPFYEHQGTGYLNLIIAANLITLLWITSLFVFHQITFPIAPNLAFIYPSTPFLANTKGILIIATISSAISIIFLLKLLTSYGSFASFMFAVKVEKAMAGSYIIRQMAVISGIISIYGILTSIYPSRSSSPDKNKSTWIFAMLLISNLGVIYLWGGRFYVAILIAILGLSYHFSVKKLNYLKLLVAAGTMLILFQFLRLLRDSMLSEITGVVTNQTNNLTLISLSLHWAEYDAFLLAIRDVNITYQTRWGEDFYNGLVSWVPRFLWEDKPQTFHVGGWFRQLYEPHIINGWPVTVMGSWFVNFNWMGIILGPMISSLFIGAADYVHKKRPSIWGHIMCFTVGLAIIAGGLNTGAAQSLFLYLIPLHICSLGIEKLSKLKA